MMTESGVFVRTKLDKNSLDFKPAIPRTRALYHPEVEVEGNSQESLS